VNETLQDDEFGEKRLPVKATSLLFFNSLR
jgi:hypothetical protein